MTDISPLMIGAPETGLYKRDLRPLSIFDRSLIVPAIWASFRKLDPRTLVKKPVMFCVEIVSVLTTIFFLRDHPLDGNTKQILFLLRPRSPEERSPSEPPVRSPLGAGGAVGFAILDPEAAEGARATQDYRIGGDADHGADKFGSRSETAPSLRLGRC